MLLFAICICSYVRMVKVVKREIDSGVIVAMSEFFSWPNHLHFSLFWPFGDCLC